MYCCALVRNDTLTLSNYVTKLFNSNFKFFKMMDHSLFVELKLVIRIIKDDLVNFF